MSAQNLVQPFKGTNQDTWLTREEVARKDPSRVTMKAYYLGQLAKSWGYSLEALKGIQ